jgi:signal transduction histidine kinase
MTRAVPRLTSTVARLVAAVFALQLLAGAGAILFLHSSLIEAARDERKHDVVLLRDALLEAYYDGGRPALADQLSIRDEDPDVFIALTPPRSVRAAPLLINLLHLPRITASAAPHLVEIRRAGAAEPRPGVAVARALPDGGTLIVGAVITGERRFNVAFTEATGITIAVSVALALVSALVLGLALDRRTRELAETARRLAAGDFTARVPPHSRGDGFDELRDQMNRMAERIDRLVSELRSVSGALAHDLRSPVARLTAALDTAMAAREQIGDDDAAREALAAARTDAEALRTMLETALELARVEGGALADRREMIDLAPVAEDLVELYEPLAEQSGVSLEVDAQSVTAPIDRELVSRSLANLIDNALKYGGQRILVTTAPVGPFAEIIVRDDGPGIASADRARAVERFTRLDNARTQPGGGLGLAMVDAVARLHGGTLVLGGDEGLIATLRLPRG